MKLDLEKGVILAPFFLIQELHQVGFCTPIDFVHEDFLALIKAYSRVIYPYQAERDDTTLSLNFCPFYSSKEPKSMMVQFLKARR